MSSTSQLAKTMRAIGAALDVDGHADNAWKIPTPPAGKRGTSSGNILFDYPGPTLA